MDDLYNTIYTNPIHVDECLQPQCIAVISTDPSPLTLNPPFDTILHFVFPWFKGTEAEFLNGLSTVSHDIHSKSWYEAWTKFRLQHFVKLGYKEYLAPRVTDVEISFIESMNLIRKGYGIKIACFKGLWDVWRAEVQRPYWVYNSGNCRYGYSLDSRTGKHSMNEKLITKRITELTGDTLTGYETAVCGCGSATCCNVNKIYIHHKGFFFKGDACRLGLLPPEHCRSTKCWQEHCFPPTLDKIHCLIDEQEPQ